MRNTILLYSGIYSFTAEEFINKLNSIPTEEPITVRLNSPGGSVFAGWGMIAAITEREGETLLKVDGNAASMAFIMTLFFDKVEALDVTGFMVHRASAYIETPDDQKMLDTVNEQLREKLKARVDDLKFKEITGISIDDIFDAEIKRDIWLSAKDAQKIGLVDKVVRLEPREIDAINDKLVAFADVFNKEVDDTQGSDGKDDDNNNSNNQKNKKVMDLNSFRNEHPDIYAQVINIERDRVLAFLAFAALDLEGVKKKIEDGSELTQQFTAEMVNKAISSKLIEAVEKGSPGDAKGGDTKDEDGKPKDAKDEAELLEAKKKEELAKAEKEIFAAAGIKIKED